MVLIITLEQSLLILDLKMYIKMQSLSCSLHPKVGQTLTIVETGLVQPQVTLFFNSRVPSTLVQWDLQIVINLSKSLLIILKQSKPLTVANSFLNGMLIVARMTTWAYYYLNLWMMTNGNVWFHPSTSRILLSNPQTSSILSWITFGMDSTQVN